MNAVHFAEQATLGSVLFEPAAADTVATLLRAEDFAHPWHRAVFTTIRERHIAGAPLGAEFVGPALVERLGYRKADLPRVLDLLQAAPIHPHAQRYAAMVLEASLRRQVACHGVLLEAAALSASLEMQRGPVARTAGLVDATLRDAEQRWFIAAGGRADAEAAAPTVPPTRFFNTALGADRLLRAHPPLDSADVSENEARLVAALVTHPADISTTAAWLRPEALTDPAWRPVYAALVQLAESGQPIDVVTVNWEVRRASARLGPGPGTRELREAVDLAAASDPRYLGRAVASDQLRTTAAHAADALRSCAGNPGIDLVDVLQTGHLVTAALCEKASVLPERPSDSAPQRHLAAVHDRTPTRDVESRRGVLGPVAG